MIEKEIKSFKEKLKEIRTLLKATQSLIGGDEYSKTYIGYLERGDCEPTPAAINWISKRVSELSIKRNIELNINSEYFSESDESQFDRIIYILIDGIKKHKTIDNLEKNIKEVEEFMDKYPALVKEKHKYEIYKLAVEMFYDNYEFEKCKTYILRCLDSIALTKDAEELGKTAVYFLNIYIYSKDFKQVIIYGDYYLSKNIDKKSEARIRYLISKAYKSLGNIDKCMIDLEMIQSQYKLDDDDFLKVKILYANCMKEKNKYDISEDLYNSLLKFSRMVNLKQYEQMIYINITDLYMRKTNYQKAYEYINKALEIKIEYENMHEIIPYIYYNAFEICLNLKNNEIDKYYNCSIESFEKTKNYKMQICTYKLMLQYFIENKKDDEIISLVDTINTKVTSKVIEDNNILYLLYLAKEYFFNEEKVNYIINIILNLIQYLGEKKYK
jgi:tetratricopeptide (TPR) repeat protein